VDNAVDNFAKRDVVFLTLTRHNSVMTNKYTDTFQGLLDSEYYSIGVTGAEALATMLDDYNSERMADFLAAMSWVCFVNCLSSSSSWR
jgi:hypothetical protein